MLRILKIIFITVASICFTVNVFQEKRGAFFVIGICSILIYTGLLLFSDDEDDDPDYDMDQLDTTNWLEEEDWKIDEEDDRPWIH